MAFQLFHRSISFSKPDPLDNGLREEIEAERLEPEAIRLEDISGEELENYVHRIEEDIKKDPEWFHFENE